jgi:hypothetical protein
LKWHYWEIFISSLEIKLSKIMLEVAYSSFNLNNFGLMKWYKMESSNHIFTPLEVGLKLIKNDYPTTKIKHLLMEIIPYWQLVGNLMHVIIYTRLDRSYLIGCLAQFLSDHGEIHWKVVKCVFQHINSTLHKCIKYQNCESNGTLIGYLNVDYGGDINMHHSTSSYCLGENTLKWSTF